MKKFIHVGIQNQGWEDSPTGKVLATQEWRPEFEYPVTGQKDRQDDVM